MDNKIKKEQYFFTNYPAMFVFLFFAWFLFSFPAYSKAATLYLLPAAANLYLGDGTVVEVRLNSEGEEINAVQAELRFPANTFEIVNLGKGNSILTLWPQEPFFVNSSGKISFVGGIPNGFKGDGLVGTFILRGKNLGEGAITFSDNCQVLLNDGKGTSTEIVNLEGVYRVIEKPVNLPQISSFTHPDQSRWFKTSTFHVHWDFNKEAEYSFLLSQDSMAEPDETADRPAGELEWMGDLEYPNLKDGIYYFSLKQKLPGENWQEKVGYRLMVDATPPEPFDLQIGREPSVFEGKYFLSFNAIDRSSGVDNYEIFEGRKKLFSKEIIGEWRKGKSPYVLEDQELKSIIRVKAVDKAGNERLAELLPPAKPFPYWIILVLFIGLIMVFFIVRKIKYQKSKIKNTNQK